MFDGAEGYRKQRSVESKNKHIFVNNRKKQKKKNKRKKQSSRKCNQGKLMMNTTNCFGLMALSTMLQINMLTPAKLQSTSSICFKDRTKAQLGGEIVESEDCFVALYACLKFSSQSS